MASMGQWVETSLVSMGDGGERISRISIALFIIGFGGAVTLLVLGTALLLLGGLR